MTKDKKPNKTDYDKAEEIYERYFIKSRIGYKDSILLTKSCQTYGTDTVISALRQIYKQGNAGDVASFAYVDKVAERIHLRRKDKEREEAESLKKNRIYQDRTRRIQQVPGLLAGCFKVYFKKQSESDYQAVYEWAYFGGEKPNRSLARWDKSWQTFKKNKGGDAMG